MATEAQDIREGGTWTPLQRAKNDLIFVLVGIAIAIAERLPSFLLRAMGTILGAIAYVLLPSARRRAIANLMVAGLDPKIAFASFCTLGRELGDAIAHLDPKRDQPLLPFAPGAREVFEEAIAEGRGVVFASAHIAPWERVASTLVASGIPLTVVAREPYDPRFRRLYDRLRGARGVRTVYRGESGAGVGMVRVLKRKEVLGIPMDLRSRVPSIDVPFLGRPVPTAVGPARLALRTGAVVIAGTASRRSDGRIGIAAKKISLDDLGQDPELELTRRLNEALTERIRALPEAWPWMHDRAKPT